MSKKTVTISSNAYYALNKKIELLKNENIYMLNIINKYRDSKIHEYRELCDLYIENDGEKITSTKSYKNTIKPFSLNYKYKNTLIRKTIEI
jgi:hypothetical protein